MVYQEGDENWMGILRQFWASLFLGRIYNKMQGPVAVCGLPGRKVQLPMPKLLKLEVAARQ